MFAKNPSLKLSLLILIIPLFLSPQSFSSKNVYWSEVDEFAYLAKNSARAKEVRVGFIGTGGFAGCIGVGLYFDKGDEEKNKGVAVAHVNRPPLPKDNEKYYTEDLPNAFSTLLALVPIDKPFENLTAINILSGEGSHEKMIREAFEKSLKVFGVPTSDLDPVANFMYYISGEDFSELLTDQKDYKMFNNNPGDGMEKCEPDFTNTAILKAIPIISKNTNNNLNDSDLGNPQLNKTTHSQQTSYCGKLCALL